LTIVISSRSFSPRSFFPSLRSVLLASAAVAGCIVLSPQASAQDPAQTTPVNTQTTTDGKVTTTTSTAIGADGKPVQSVSSTMTFHRGKKKPEDQAKQDKTVQSKDTKKKLANEHKVEQLAGVDSKLPDKQLFDKAVVAMNKGHYDVARLDLQTMLNTYPDSQYQMRAKLAIADSWYKEGGTAALTQAESEYADFRVFFPNAPEAAEAQMRIGDIYFRQMDRPDRDYAKALNAETEYRRMLTDYPDSVLVPQAKQRLRDVQEVLATREADIAQFYGTRSNFAAVIARYQTVADTYPLYSHMDDVLIGLGDAFEQQARFVRARQDLPEGGKAKLEQLYDSEAADAYRKVVLEHAAAPHVEDAKDRLAAMNLPIPTPTPEQLAASVALENSRSQYRITDYARLFFMKTPDTVMASHIGDPKLTDPTPTTAPTVLKRANDEFRAAFTPPATTPAALTPNPASAAAAGPAVAAPDPAKPAAPLAFEDVPTADRTGRESGSVMSTSGATSTSTPGGTSAGMNVEIITHPAGTTTAPATTPAADPNNPLKPVGPPDTTPLPAAEQAAAPPDVPNTITAPTPPAQAANANGKNPAPVLDKKDESTSKKKKGLGKLNPF
jgi:outer membrane protein assembly factor BamD